mmetsp:Transcript_32792/g.85819  ORF Transcript_32792/g.85819 Transcript_32792/m.85819 type:complete len:218 (-) Transcript_32792:257-910(-)
MGDDGYSANMTARATVAGPPLDYSFCELPDVESILDETPRGGKTKDQIEADDQAKREADAKKPKAAFTLEKPKRTHVDPPREVTQVLKLNNNRISTMAGIDSVLPKLVHDPFRLTMLDLSFNQLERVEKVLLQFENLGVLYMHGNQICGLKNLDTLAKLPILKAVTLHGNDIEHEKSYKNYAISAIRGLKTLDFNTITTRERDTAQRWAASRGKGKK